MSGPVAIGHKVHWRYVKSRRVWKAAGGAEIEPTEVPVGRGRVTLGWKLIMPGRRERPVFGTVSEAMFAAEGIHLRRPPLPKKHTRRTRTRRSR